MCKPDNFKLLYPELLKISKKYENSKIVFGKLVIKRFQHIWHTGDENFGGFKEVINFNNYIITSQDNSFFDKVKTEIMEALKNNKFI